MNAKSTICTFRSGEKAMKNEKLIFTIPRLSKTQKEVKMVRVRIPQVACIDHAIELYYSKIELTGKDISELFGGIPASRIAKLKSKAREVSAKNDRMMWDNRNVNTEDAYEAWGLDIKDLERRAKKLAEIRKRQEV